MAQKKQPVDLAKVDTAELFRLANGGNSEALEVARKRYREKPELARLYGDLEYSAREFRMKRFFGEKAQGTTFAVRENLESIAKRVAGDNPTPLEKLLADRVAMCWLDVQQNEHQYAELGNDTLTKYEWRSRMLDRAHKRYLSAIKTLATVRKLGIPAIQVNIGDKQINTVGGVQTPNNGNLMDE